MMTPQEAFAAIREASEIAVDVAAVAGLMHLRDSGYTREQAEAEMDEMLRMISYGMPGAIGEISEQCIRIAATQNESAGSMRSEDASKAMASTAYAVYARLGYSTANALMSRKAAKGGAA
jgi:hypothetical protein